MKKQEIKSEQINNYYNKENAKYLEAFNNNNDFISFSIKAFVFNVFIAAKYKLFGFYFLFLLLNIATTLMYVYPEYVSDSAIVVFTGITAIFLLIFAFNFNNLVLKKIVKNKSINSSFSVFVLGVIFFAPNSVIAYDYYQKYKLDKLYEQIEVVNNVYTKNKEIDDKNLIAVVDKIKGYKNTHNINLVNMLDNSVADNVICFYKITPLKALQELSYAFDSGNLATAIDCGASEDIFDIVAKDTQLNSKDGLRYVRKYIRKADLVAIKKLFDYTNVNPSFKKAFSYLYQIKDREKRTLFYNYFAQTIPLEKKETSYYSSPVYYAVKDNQLEAVKILLERGANFTLLSKRMSSYDINKISPELLTLMVDNGFSPQRFYPSSIKSKKNLEILLNNPNFIVGYDFVKSSISKNDAKINAIISDKFGKKSIEKLSKYETDRIVDNICYYQNIDLLKHFVKYIDSKSIFADRDCYNPIIMDILVNHIDKKLDFNQAKYNLMLLDKRNKVYKDDKEAFKLLQYNVLVDIAKKTNYSFNTLNKGKGWNDLHHLYNNPQLLKLALDKQKKLGILSQTINKQDKYGKSPIFYAAKNSKSLQLFIDYGADLNLQENSYNRTVFYYANTQTYDILKQYAKPHQLAEYECYQLVEKDLNKEYQNSCNIAAQTKNNIVNKTFALFIGGDIKQLLSYEKQMLEADIKTHYYGHANIGHGYLLQGDLENTKKFYKLYIDGAIKDNRDRQSYDDLMRTDFRLIKGLYGEEKHTQALKIWNDLEEYAGELLRIHKEKKYKENKYKGRDNDGC